MNFYMVQKWSILTSIRVLDNRYLLDLDSRFAGKVRCGQSN
jgi:hypothetical protein